MSEEPSMKGIHRYRCILEGPPQNQSFIMLESANWCRSNTFASSIKAIWNKFQRWLKQYSNWLYIHKAIQLVSDLAIRLLGDPTNEKFRLSMIHIMNKRAICKGSRYDIWQIQQWNKKGKMGEMDIPIDKVMTIRTSFMQDIENNQWRRSSFVYGRCNSFLCYNAPNSH